jgi:hypothetical protein
MSKYNPNFKSLRRSKQRGAVTLIISFIILVAMAIGTYAVVNTTLLESRMNSNDLKGRQALQRAQAGIDYFLSGLESNNINVNYLCAATLDDYGFELSFGLDADGDPIVCEEIPFEISTKFDNVRSTGYSDDRESLRIIESTIDLTINFNFGFAVPPPDPTAGGDSVVRTKGDVTLGGNAQLARCGGTGQSSCNLLASPGNKGTPLYDANDMLVVAGGSVDTNKNVADTNTTPNDQEMQDITPDQLFEKYVGAVDGSGVPIASLADYAALADQPNSPIYTYTPGSTDRGGDFVLGEKRYIYVDATTSPLKLTGGQIGGPGESVILVVKGNLEIVGNVTIWGTVYADNMDFGRGTATIVGSLIAQGEVDLTGTVQIYNDPSQGTINPEADPARLLANAQGRSSTVRLGSWREIYVN